MKSPSLRFHLIFLAAAVLLAAGARVALSFTEPIQTPPQANVLAPINVSSVGQTKTGSLVVNGFSVSGSGSVLTIPNGNVAIGKASANHPLDVVGKIQATGDICTDLAGGKCLSAVAGSAGLWAANGTNISNTNSGNVGIGDTAFNAKLRVNGAAAANVFLDREDFTYFLDPNNSGTSGKLAGELSADTLSACHGGSCSHLRWYGDNSNYLRGTTYSDGLLFVRDNNLRIDNAAGGWKSELQSAGQLYLHPDADRTGDDAVVFTNSNGDEVAQLQDGDFKTSGVIESRRAADGCNSGILNLWDTTNDRGWHITNRRGCEGSLNDLKFWFWDGGAWHNRVTFGNGGVVETNPDNVTGGGIKVADDGGFYDYNNGWIDFRGSNGVRILNESGGWDNNRSIRAGALCIRDDCKTSWSQVGGGIGSESDTLQSVTNRGASTNIRITTAGLTASGDIDNRGYVAYSNRYYDDDTRFYIDANTGSQVSTIYANNWFRAQGNTGLYFENWGGGWFMQDSTWIRAYNDKNIYTPGEMQAGTIRANGNLCIGNDCRTGWPGASATPNLQQVTDVGATTNRLLVASKFAADDGAGACCAPYWTISVNEGGGNQPTLQFHDSGVAEGQIILQGDIGGNQRGFRFQSTQSKTGIRVTGKLGFDACNSIDCGIWLWDAGDSNHVIYSANPSGAPGNLQGAWDAGHRFRFRTCGNSSAPCDQGFLFENSANQRLMDLDSDDGRLWISGSVGIDDTAFNAKLRVNGAAAANTFLDREDFAYFLDPNNAGLSANIAGTIRTLGYEHGSAIGASEDVSASTWCDGSFLQTKFLKFRGGIYVGSFIQAGASCSEASAGAEFPPPANNSCSREESGGSGPC